MKLRDEVCVAICATRAIGRAIADEFAHQGAELAIVDLKNACGW